MLAVQLFDQFLVALFVKFAGELLQFVIEFLDAGVETFAFTFG